MTGELISSSLVQRAAWTLAHFLWEGALIAAVTAGLLKLLSTRTAQARYAVACGALCTMIAVPAVTFVFYAQAGAVSRAVILRIAEFMDPAVLSGATVSPLSSEWTAWVVCGWLTGFALTSMRLLMGWRLMNSLLRSASDAVPLPVKALFERMRTAVRLEHPVRLLLSEQFDGPAVIGWWRPVVLLPITAITGLDAEQLQAVLAHELAHIRRHDFLMNVLQQCVESLLFYHPAVWWLSHRIRAEREHVCDDLAVAVCGDPAVYARALIELEHARLNAPAFAMAAAGGNLKSRIRRVFGRIPEKRDWREAAAAAMFVLTVLVAAAWQTRTIEAHAHTPLNTEVMSYHAGAEGSAASASFQKPGRGAVLAAALLSLAPGQTVAAPLQNPAIKKASIAGVVLRAGSADPVAGAHVTISAVADPATGRVQAAAPAPAVITDSEGHFELSDLDPGMYRISLAAAGYARQEYGQHTSDGPGSVLTLVAGLTMKDLTIHMNPAGTISGFVRDTNGQPVVGIPVNLFKTTYNGNGARMNQVIGKTRTDDRGQYRLYWVTPGRYYLSAGTEPGPAGPRGASTSGVSLNEIPGESFPMTYYPAAADLERATIIEVRSDAEVSADFVLGRLPQALYKVRGKVVDARTGAHPSSILLTFLYRTFSGGISGFASGSSYDPATGEFEMRNVAPGSYYLQASGGPQPNGTVGPVANGRTPVTVSNADLEGVLVTLGGGVSLTGRVRIDGQQPKAGFNRPRIQLRSSRDGVPAIDPFSTVSEVVSEDGTFQLNDVTPGEYRVNFALVSPEYYVREIRYGGIDAMSKPILVTAGGSDALDVALSTNVAQIEGTILDDKSQPVKDVQAVLIPDQQRDLPESIRTTNADQNGHFTFRGVAPGQYKLFAWEDIEPYEYFDPEFIKRFEARGQHVNVAVSGTNTISLKLIPADSQ